MPRSPAPSRDSIQSKDSKYRQKNLYQEDEEEGFKDDEDSEEEEEGLSTRTSVENRQLAEQESVQQEQVQEETTSYVHPLRPERKSEDKQEGVETQFANETTDTGDKNMRYFVNQLKQVNNIISDLLYQLGNKCENREQLIQSRTVNKDKKGGFCGLCRSQEKNLIKHKHRNINQMRGSRRICCIKISDEKTKNYEDCLLCQLINLQERVDTLLTKQYSGSSEHMRGLKDEQEKLKEMVKVLIMKCDGEVLLVDDVGGKGELSSKQLLLNQLSNDRKRNCQNNEQSNKDSKLFRYSSDASKRNRIQDSVFLNCVNELVILVKSMNCVSSPGTFWQKRLTDVDRKKSERCCRREYPHMHGDLNGVPIIMKLHPSKSRKTREIRENERIEVNKLAQAADGGEEISRGIEVEEEEEEEDVVVTVIEEEEEEDNKDGASVKDEQGEPPKEKGFAEGDTDSESDSGTESLSDEQAEHQYSDELEYAIEVKEDEERSKYKQGKTNKMKKKSKENKEGQVEQTTKDSTSMPNNNIKNTSNKRNSLKKESEAYKERKEEVNDKIEEPQIYASILAHIQPTYSVILNEKLQSLISQLFIITNKINVHSCKNVSEENGNVTGGNGIDANQIKTLSDRKTLRTDKILNCKKSENTNGCEQKNMLLRSVVTEEVTNPCYKNKKEKQNEEDRAHCSYSLVSSSSSATTIYSTCSEKKDKYYFIQYYNVRDQYEKLSKVQNTNGDLNKICDSSIVSIYEKRPDTFNKISSDSDTLKKISRSKSLESNISLCKSDVLHNSISFDSLLKTVLEANKNKFINCWNTGGIKQKKFNKMTVEKERNESHLDCNVNKFRSQLLTDNSDESVSSLSMCSNPTFKSKNQSNFSRIQFGINGLKMSKKHLMRCDITKTQREQFLSQGKRENSLQNNYLGTSNSESTDVESINRTECLNSQSDDNSVYSKRTLEIIDDDNGGGEVNDFHKKSCLVQNLDEPKPQIKHLEEFLNLVRENQKTFDLNFSGDGNWRNDKTDLLSSNGSDTDFNESCYSFKSCRNTSSAEFLDASSSIHHGFILTPPSCVTTKKPNFNSDIHSRERLDDFNTCNDRNLFYSNKDVNNSCTYFENSEYDDPELPLDELHMRSNVSGTNSSDDSDINFPILALPPNYSEGDGNEEFSDFKNVPKGDTDLNFFSPYNSLLSYLSQCQDNCTDTIETELCLHNYLRKNLNRNIICANFSVFNDKNNDRSKKENINDNTLQNMHNASRQVMPNSGAACEEDQQGSLQNYSFTNGIDSGNFSFQSSNVIAFSNFENTKVNASTNEPDRQMTLEHVKFNSQNEPKFVKKKNYAFRNNKSFEFRYNHRINNQKNQQGELVNKASKLSSKLNNNSDVVCTNIKEREQNMKHICFIQNEKRTSHSAEAGDMTTSSGVPVSVYNKNNCIKFKRFNNASHAEGSIKPVKGILKKKNEINYSKLQAPISEELNETTDTSQMSKKKKSVKFTVPIEMDHSVNSVKEYLKYNRQIEIKCDREREKQHEDKMTDIKKEKVAREPICGDTNFKIIPSVINNIKYQTTSYNVLTKYSRRNTLQHLQQIENKMKRSDSSLYLDVSARNSYSAFMYLMPNRIYKNEKDFIQSKDLMVISEKYGFLEKFETVSVIQYCKPVNISKNVGGTISKNLKPMKSAKFMAYGSDAKNTANVSNKTPVVFKPGVSKIQLSDNLKLKAKPKQAIVDVSDGKVEYNESNDNHLNKKKTMFGKTDSLKEWSHFLFDISTTSDAVLSLTAYENDLALNDIYNVNIESLLQEHCSKAEQLLMGRSSSCSDSQFDTSTRKDLSTVNIVLCNLLKQKPLERKNINLRGTIVDYREPIRELATTDDIEEFPVHDKIQSCEELSSSDYNEEYKKYLQESEQVKLKQIKLNHKREKNHDLPKGEKENCKQKSKITQKLNKNCANSNPFSFHKKENLPVMVKTPLYVDSYKTYDANIQFPLTSLFLQDKLKQQSCAGMNKAVAGLSHVNTNNTKYRKMQICTTESGDSVYELNVNNSDCNKSQFTCESDDLMSDLKCNRLAAVVSNDSYLNEVSPGSALEYSGNLHKKHRLNSGNNDFQTKRSRSNQLTITDKSRMNDEKCNEQYSESKFKELVDVNNSCTIQQVVENNSSEIQLKLSQSSLELKEGFEKINQKKKIKDIVSQMYSAKKEILKNSNMIQHNPHIKPYYPHNEYDTIDCYGAPLKNSLDLEFYNEFGKPIADIHGCRIYDTFGIPKTGAYGKPIHSILRNNLKTILNNVKTNSQMPPEQNINFEEDLLHVLNSYHGLKTDLYGRLYDFYGRPLFDRYGYLQYDVNGNPLTDAYNRSLRDSDGKPLITATYNSAQFENHTRISKRPNNGSEITTNDNCNKENNFKPKEPTSKVKSILSSNHNKLSDSTGEKSVKKQVSFDECTIVYLENKIEQEPRKANSLPHNIEMFNQCS